jgi:hypothetical protein
MFFFLSYLAESQARRKRPRRSPIERDKDHGSSLEIGQGLGGLLGAAGGHVDGGIENLRAVSLPEMCEGSLEGRCGELWKEHERERKRMDGESHWN